MHQERQSWMYQERIKTRVSAFSLPRSYQTTINNSSQTFHWRFLHGRKQTRAPGNEFLPTSDSFVSMETNPQTGPIKKYLVNFSMRTSHCGLRSGSLWMLITTADPDRSTNRVSSINFPHSVSYFFYHPKTAQTFHVYSVCAPRWGHAKGLCVSVWLFSFFFVLCWVFIYCCGFVLHFSLWPFCTSLPLLLALLCPVKAAFSGLAGSVQ